jgi:FkbM family methyltransferase
MLTDAERKWLDDGGEATLRLDYPLTPQSIVFDVGGHTGKFTADLLAKGQDPYVHIFEPVTAFAAECARRFKDNLKVWVYDYGLLYCTTTCSIRVKGEASSIYDLGGRQEEIQLLDIVEVMERYEEVALLSVNIEGAEYVLLDRILGADIASKFVNIQIQFHKSLFLAEKRRDAIREKLSATHQERYNYPFVWESWRRK